jgi:hypothetical protein
MNYTTELACNISVGDTIFALPLDREVRYITPWTDPVIPDLLYIIYSDGWKEIRRYSSLLFVSCPHRRHYKCTKTREHLK